MRASGAGAAYRSRYHARAWPSLLPLLLILLFLFLGCSKPNLIDPNLILAVDPAHFVRHIFQDMAIGKIDDSKIIYYDDTLLMPVLQPLGERFHNVVSFPIQDIKLSPYDATTQTVAYSCVVPHPGVAYWQWRPVDAAALREVPKGLPMQGRLKMVHDNDHGWRVKVENDANPIVLYKRVVSAANGTWITFRRSQNGYDKVSSEEISFTLTSLVEEYAKCLGIPEKDQAEFVKRIGDEAARVKPH